jgi:Mg2+-importing ATPase
VASSLAVVTVALVLPFTPPGGHLGFLAPPAVFFLVLAGILVAYLLAVEGMKQLFFRHLDPSAP